MASPEKILYTATATATGGRTGTAKSSDGKLDVTLTTVKELGGDGAPARTRNSCSRPATRPASSAR
jgi:organic hydroperoxide reductase OsmC/OhrA